MGTKRNIKSVLLDQTVVAGLGNIYVDEALFKARIHPERMAQSLSKEEVKVCMSKSLPPYLKQLKREAVQYEPM